MANKDTPIGGRIRGALHSAEFNCRVNQYIIPETDSNEYFVNDFVSTNETSEGGIPIAVKSVAGQRIRGIITSFISNEPSDSSVYRAPYKRKTALVCDDPLVLFEIQVTGSLAETDIGKNGDIVVAAGSASTGVSGTQLDGTSLGTETKQVKIISIMDDEGTVLGNYTTVLAMILLHEYDSGAGTGTDEHNDLLNLSYDLAGHGTGKAGFQRGTTRSPVDPAVTDDANEGYVPGDLWLNNTSKSLFDCVDNTVGAAVWNEIEHSISDIWDRSAPTITPANAGDDLDMGAGDISATNADFSGKLTVGGIIDPTALLLDPQSSDPSTAPGAIYYTNVTDQFLFREGAAWRTIDSATGLDQEQIYYVGDAGNDSNDGKSVDHPFLTDSHAVDVVTAQVPSNTNRFTIKKIGSADASLISKTLPVYTTFNAEDSKVTISNLIMLGHSNIYFNDLITPNNGIAIQITTAGTQRLIKGRNVIPGTNSTFLAESNSAQAFIQVDNLDMNNTGSTIFTSTGAGGTIFFDCNNYIEDTASSVGSALIIRDIRAEGFFGNTRQTTANNFIYDVQGVRTLEMYPGSFKYPNTALFGAALSTPQPESTGDGTVYKIPYDTESIDVTSAFDKLTNHWFVTPVEGWYSFNVKVTFGTMVAENNSLKINLQIDDDGGSPWGTIELHNINVGPVRATGNFYTYATTFELNIPSDYRVYVTTQGTRSSGFDDNITIESSIFNGRLVRQTA